MLPHSYKYLINGTLGWGATTTATSLTIATSPATIAASPFSTARAIPNVIAGSKKKIKLACHEKRNNNAQLHGRKSYSAMMYMHPYVLYVNAFQV